MLYEKKRTFGCEPIDLSAAVFAVAADVFAGLAVSTTAGTAKTLDYEADNQHFPEENTLEVYGFKTATSVGGAATVIVTLQSSDSESEWVDEISFPIAEANIKNGKLIKRFTIPAHTKRHLRLKIVVGTEVFTAGKILVFVRPL